MRKIKWENNAFTLPNGNRCYSVEKVEQTPWAPNGKRDEPLWSICKSLHEKKYFSYRDEGAPKASRPRHHFFPYQNAGIDYMLKQKKVLLADDQGLGKTIQVAGLINELDREALNDAHPTQPSILVICPASLKENWRIELHEWCIGIHSDAVDVVYGYKHKFKQARVRIVNYELCHKLKDKIGDHYDLVVLDEVHYLKNCTSKRTQAILGDGGIARSAERVVAISGTPVENRPIELWPLVATIFKKYWPHELRSYRAYGEYFCAGYDEQVRIYTRQGMKYKKEFNVRGASNLNSLNALLRERFMIRRLKKDVLPQLPAKQYSVVDITMSQIEERTIGGLLRQENEYAEDVLRSIETGQRLPPMEEMASVRQELGIMKIPFAKEFAEKILAGGESVILFVYHTAVAEALAEELKDYGVSMIIGKTPAKKRQKMVEDFQSGRNKVFVGNLIAAGTGLTLTKACNVIFVESSWVPGQNEQAVDRAHRISQERKVHAYFLTWYGSMDAQILRTSINKQKNINRIMK